MFDPEQSIAEWRRQMLAAGIKTPVPLEELECHLREAVQKLTASGMEPQVALAAAIKKIGLPIPLQAEFTKVDKKSRLTEQFVINLLVYALWFCLVLPLYLYTFFKYDMNWVWRLAGIANVIFGHPCHPVLQTDQHLVSRHSQPACPADHRHLWPPSAVRRGWAYL